MKATSHIIAILLGLVVSVNAANVVCIGLNEYSGYKDLKCAENDAARIAALLQEQGHNTTLLIKENVTREKVINALKDESSIVYFAGHGEKGRLVVSDGEIKIEEMASRSAMILLDCCYVGGDLKKAGETKIFAAAEYEAFESDGHGLFTKYLLKWLGKGKAFSDGDMLEYIRKAIRKETGGWQTPVLGYI